MTNTDDFSSLKRNSKTSLQTYKDEAKKLNTTYQSDERFWTLTVDKSGNGKATIRFLPQTKGETTPFVKYFTHAFETTPKNWYIENCPTTLDGEPCPVCELNTSLWSESGKDENHPKKAKARAQKRKLYYVSNIYVVNDDANPENNGKVFLYRYGKKIFEKIHLSMNPQYKGDEAVNPFDFWEGANFVLKQRMVEKYPNFDLSSFSASSPLLDDDNEIKKVWQQQHSLLPFIDAKNFKSYDVLKKRLDKVLGKPTTSTEDQPDEDTNEEAPFHTTELKKAFPKEAAPAKKVSKAANPEDFFKELMDEDE